MDQFGAALNSLVNSMGTLGGDRNETTEVRNSTTIQNLVKTSITQEVIQETISTAIATNDLKVEANGAATVSVRGVTLSATAGVVLNALSQNVLVQDAVAQMESTVEQTASDEQKGLTDLVDSFFGGVAGVVGSLGGLLQAGALPSIILFCCICSVVLVFMMVKMGGKDGAAGGGGGGGFGGGFGALRMNPYMMAASSMF